MIRSQPGGEFRVRKEGERGREGQTFAFDVVFGERLEKGDRLGGLRRAESEMGAGGVDGVGDLFWRGGA
jgi:hypothetical protein